MRVDSDPIRVALEYVSARNDMIERYQGAGRAILGNAERVTQLQFIQMCNQFATRFADEFPLDWNIPEWERFSRFNLRDMSTYIYELPSNLRPKSTLTLTEWEACSELAKTYLALLRMRLTP